MATEPNLRDLFHSDTRELPAIDTRSVIRRSKTRRLPAQVGIGGVFTLAIGGLGVAGLQGLGSTQMASDSAISTSEQAPADQAPLEPGNEIKGMIEGDSPTSGIKRAPADRINLCGGTLAEVAPSATGLVLTVNFADAAVGTEPIAGTVTLTNTGTEQIAGYSSPTPAITLSQNGVVLWHSNGPTIMSIQDVMLAPGESLEYAASFTPVVCAVEDDTAEQFRTDLPAAPAGEYQLSAAADVSVDGVAELVTGPTKTIRIG